MENLKWFWFICFWFIFAVPIKYFKTDQMWDFTKFTVKTEQIEYGTELGSTKWSEVEFTLILRRKPLYHIFYLIIPSTIIGFIGIFSLLMPFDTDAKLNLPLTMLLAITVFMLALVSTTPETSESIPLISM